MQMLKTKYAVKVSSSVKYYFARNTAEWQHDFMPLFSVYRVDVGIPYHSELFFVKYRVSDT